MAGPRDAEITPSPSAGEYLKIAHVNAESLRAHWTDFTAIMARRGDDIMAISETHLHPDHSDLSYMIPGYSIFRNDRTYSDGGGVAVYVRDGFRARVVNASSATHEDRGEFLFLQVGEKT